MFLRRFLSLAVLCLPCFLPAAEITDFVPSAAQHVLRIDLSGDFAGLNEVRNDLLTTVSRQSGFDEKNGKSSNIIKLLDEIVIFTPNLTEDFTFVLVKTKMTEKDFCSELEKMTGAPLVSVKNTRPPEYRIEFANFGVGTLVAPKKRVFAFAFLTENIAVWAKDSLQQFRSFKNTGLNSYDRKTLMVPKSIAAGFVKMDQNFLLENPLIPPFERAEGVLAPGPGNSLQIDLRFATVEKPAAKQLQKYLQQMVMVGAMLLNQTDEELMAEWMSSVKVKREHNLVTVKGLFTQSFITRLAGLADQQLRENAAGAPGTVPAPPAAPAAQPAKTERKP